MNTFRLFVLACLLTPSAPAESLKTVDGTIYLNYSATRLEPDGLSITHSEGTAKIPLERLSVDILKRHGYPVPENLTTEDGKVFRNYAIVDAAPGGLTIQHDEGTTKVAPEQLPEDMRKRHGYDPANLMTMDGTIYWGFTVVRIDRTGLTISHKDGVKKLGFDVLPDEMGSPEKATMRFSGEGAHQSGKTPMPGNFDSEKDLVTLDGKIYKNYSVTRIEAGRISIRHDGGFVRIPLNRLPDELRKLHVFDPFAVTDPEPEKPMDTSGGKEGNQGTPPTPDHNPAKDLRTADGTIYRNYTVTKVEPDGLSIRHESGTTKIDFERLPPEIQKRHGYDPFLAYDHDKKEAKRMQQENENLRAKRKERQQAAARATSAKEFEEGFKQSANWVRLSAGKDSVRVCNGIAGASPTTLQATGAQGIKIGITCDLTVGHIGRVPVWTGKIKTGERKGWVFHGHGAAAYVEFTAAEIQSLQARRALRIQEADGKISTLGHEGKVWRIGQVRVTDLSGQTYLLPRYTKSDITARSFYLAHGLPPKSADRVEQITAPAAP